MHRSTVLYQLDNRQWVRIHTWSPPPTATPSNHTRCHPSQHPPSGLSPAGRSGLWYWLTHKLTLWCRSWVAYRGSCYPCRTPVGKERRCHYEKHVAGSTRPVHDVRHIICTWSQPGCHECAICIFCIYCTGGCSLYIFVFTTSTVKATTLDNRLQI